MTTKVCKTCKLEKDTVYFSKNKNSKDNLQPSCKKCMVVSANLWKLNNPEKVKINKVNYYKKHSVENKEEIKKYASEWRYNNRHKKSEYNKKWVEKNINYQKEYREVNKEHISKKYIERLEKDFVFKYSHNIRNLIRGSFKRGCKGVYKKGLKTESILGCSIDFFIEYISNKFKKGMTLQNHGEWHLDHIIPVSSATNEDELIKLNHYTNFQPLWSKDNLKKGSKIIN
jgi:hypothetical protein